MSAAKKIEIPWVAISGILAIVLAIGGAVHIIDGQIADKFTPLSTGLGTLQQQFTDANIKANFDGLNEKASRSDVDISKLRSALEVLKNKQSRSTQKLINDLLAAASKSDSDSASKILETAKSLISVLRIERIPSGPQYFKTTVARLQDLSKRDELAAPVLSSRLVLAGYRSSLESDKGITSGPPTTHGIILGPHSGIEKLSINGEHLTGSIITLAPSLSGKLSDQVWVKDVYLVGGSQSLDGIIWENTTFVGMRIRYTNGETSLKGVHFVNCTFDFTPGPRATSLADAIALSPTIIAMSTPSPHAATHS